jgi:hypothetical protein
MKNDKLTLPGLFLLLMLIPVPGFAFQEESEGMTNYLPLSKAETARRFPLNYEGLYTTMEADPEEKVKPKLLSSKLKIGTSGATLTKRTVGEDNDEISIVGNDKNGKEWCVILGGTPAFHGFKFYTADLDKNGIQDGVLLADTMGNGMAPTKHILTLTFDDFGRPLLFEIEGFFHEVKGGIFDVVDLNRDGHAEIIYMSHSGGYWVTSIYEISDARWKRMNGKHAERSYPLYTRFTNRPNRVAVTPKAGKNPTVDDLSNDTPKITGQLTSYQWADVSGSEDIALNVKSSDGKRIVCSPASWYSSFAVVIDSPEGRRIVSMSAPEKTFKAMLDEVVKNKYEANFFGQRGTEKVSPEILWAIGK